jgi:ParB-like chromosome segregation protein Spo0J
MMRIADIQIGERYRQDMGDIEGLARSISEIGLLHPVVVASSGLLIAGQRRIAACLMLGWTDIPARIVDLESIVQGELAENTIRKDFTPSEAVAIGKAIEPLEREAADNRQSATQGNRQTGAEKFSEPERGRALDKVAEHVGMSRPTYTKARAVVEAAEAEPEQYGHLLDQMDRTGNVSRAHKELQKARKQEERRKMAETVAVLPANDRYRIECGDVRTYDPGQQFDFIITDPPYPREYIDLYGVLAERALAWLNPGGLLLAMCGQSYLDQIMAMMDVHLEYYWTGCYYTPGQPTPLRTRQVNTTWKPILIYKRAGDAYKGKIFGDVWMSDGNDKTHHKWGQSESGMLAIVKQVCLPGQSIFDPFCGAGTTGVAALRHGCTFVGIDSDAGNVGISVARLEEVTRAYTQA